MGGRMWYSLRMANRLHYNGKREYEPGYWQEKHRRNEAYRLRQPTIRRWCWSRKPILGPGDLPHAPVEQWDDARLAILTAQIAKDTASYPARKARYDKVHAWCFGLLLPVTGIVYVLCQLYDGLPIF